MNRLDQARWQKLCENTGIQVPANTFNKLQRKYAERHRKYHNATHINACLAHLDASEHPEAGNIFLEYALWFHDAIYNTFSSKNELRSAEWACQVLRSAGVGDKNLQFVEGLIMATCHGVVPVKPAYQLMVDIDLAILGTSAERFADFERQVRQEYWWVPRKVYRQKRLAVLQSFAQREQIYTTQEFSERFETQARDNLQRSIAKLSAAD